MSSPYFKTLVSSISGDEFPLMLVTFDHSTLTTPFRMVNDNQDITSNGVVYFKSAFNLALPSQPQDGLMETTISMANTGLKDIPDFIESVKGQTVSCQIQVVLRSAPDNVEYDISLEARQFSITKQTVSAKLSAPNYYTSPAFPILYGAKYSPSLL